MQKLKILALAAGFGLMSSGALAAVVDFENEAGQPDPLNVGTSYVNGGITFDSLDTNDLQIIQTGAPTNGFVPSDSVTPAGAFGDAFLTGDFNNNSALSMTFGSALSNISFDVADIDGSGQQREIFTFDFYLGAALVTSIVRTPGDGFVPAPDGSITTIAFGGLFDKVEISNRTVGSPTGSNRNIGWGLDNINYTAVPLPAGFLLLLSGLGGLALMRRKAA